MKASLPALAALSLSLLGACAGQAPSAPLNARPVPADRLLFNQPATADGATLVMVREDGPDPSPCLMMVSVGSALAALIAPGEAVELHLPAGKQQIKLGRTGSESCDKDKNFGSTMSGRFAPGEVQQVSVQITRSTIDVQPLKLAPVIAAATAAADGAAPAAPEPAPPPVPAAAAVPVAEPVIAPVAAPAPPPVTAPVAAPVVPTVSGYTCTPLPAPASGFTCVPSAPAQ